MIVRASSFQLHGSTNTHSTSSVQAQVDPYESISSKPPIASRRPWRDQRDGSGGCGPAAGVVACRAAETADVIAANSSGEGVGVIVSTIWSSWSLTAGCCRACAGESPRASTAPTPVT